MPTPPLPPIVSPPGESRKRGPTWRQAFTIAGAGLLIAVVGCAGFLSTINFNSSNLSPLAVIGGVGFAIGVLMLFVAFLMLVILTFSLLFRNRPSHSAPGGGVNPPGQPGQPS